MRQRTKRSTQTRLNLYTDMGIFLLFVTVCVPRVTGVVIHEWLSLLFVAPFLVHILLHWKWIAKVTKRFFTALPGETRFNYLWNLVLFVFMTIASFSGFLISEALLPAIGIPMKVDRFWFVIHDVSANLLLALMGIHLAMHWKWLVRAVRRYIFLIPDRREETAGLRID